MNYDNLCDKHIFLCSSTGDQGGDEGLITITTGANKRKSACIVRIKIKFQRKFVSLYLIVDRLRL